MRESAGKPSCIFDYSSSKTAKCSYFCGANPLIHSMILFFRKNAAIVYSVGTERSLSPNDVEKLKWLFGAAAPLDVPSLAGLYIGPRKEMVSPWSTNAVE